MTGRLLLAGLLVLGLPAAASARTRRLALVIGNNVGSQGDLVLKYAETDARRVAEVLRELGSFDEVRLRLGVQSKALLGELEEGRRTVAGWRAAGDQVLFLLFYSGHADGRDLHLGGSVMPGDELLASVGHLGSQLRILILDACQAGALTRVKGLGVKPPVRVELLDDMEASGQAILASSSAEESAQESEFLQGSFFTTSLVTGLRGAADSNGDGEVGLREAYAYAYDRTVRSTVMSAAGIQHPTYSIQLSGKRDVPLTRPSRSLAFLGLRARAAGTFLVLTQNEGMVVAEVAAQAGQTHRLGLRPASYVVKKRSAGGLLVAQVGLKPRADAVLDESEMQRVPYVVLAQKGGRQPGWLTVSGGVRTSLLSVSTPGELALGYVLDLEWIALWPEVGLLFGTGSVDAPGGRPQRLQVTLLAAQASLGIIRLLRFSRWDLFFGLQGSVPTYFHYVEGQGWRDSVGFGVDGLAGGDWWVTDRIGLLARLQAGSRWLHLAADPPETGNASWASRAAAAFHLGLRLRF